MYDVSAQGVDECMLKVRDEDEDGEVGGGCGGGDGDDLVWASV